MSQGSIKVILLGESSVGKTCIINRFITDSFDKNTEGTLGASFASKTVNIDNGISYQLDVWDTAGSERFRTINKFFYRDAAISILVYDITSQESFNEIKNFWVNEVTANTEKNTGNIYHNL